MSSLTDLASRIQQRHSDWIQRWMLRHAGPPANKMYHYTDAHGLLGIVQNRAFWASDIRHLNDRTELEHGIGLVRKRLDEAARRRGSGKAASALAGIRETFHGFDVLLTAYACCFCEDGDLLSQWRGYGRSGGGYAIGISPIATRGNPPPPPRVSLRKIIYELDEKLALIDESIATLEKLMDVVFKDSSADWNEATRILNGFFRQEVGDYLWCFKHHAFKEEKEWRFCYITGPADPSPLPLQFRPAPGGVVPYVDIDLFNLGDAEHHYLEISDIVCGPTLDSQRSVETIDTLLRKCDLPNVDVRPSGVPIRR